VDILIIALLLLAVLVNYGALGPRLRTTLRRATGPALVMGAIGFAAGFFGPMLLKPEANQGPLLGIFITGPAGFALGLLYGVVRARRMSGSVPS
jgi:hypothetical protein